ncbi:dynein light intermediate chain-domain-containing protein [Melampsora americana]|nr:dynein light intermediate chain-domain-containing protein [Melampsora americana]
MISTSIQNGIKTNITTNQIDPNQTNYDQLLPGEGNLWSSILDSVSNNREKGNLPSKNLLVLGDRNTGKSTLVSYLSATTPPTIPTIGGNSTIPIPEPISRDPDDVDIGTSYTTVDIGDDNDDGYQFHQIPSCSPPYSTLLPLILNPESLKESLIMVLIPFTHPHSLLASLVRWMALIQSVIDSIKQSTKPPDKAGTGDRGEFVVEEAKEGLEAHYRSYVEPVGPPQSPSPNDFPETINGNNASIHLEIPLPPGTLTENPGVGVVVVCTKADQIDQLEKEKDFKEEQFDFIQQVLRSICLRFGGALFFTSERKPETIGRLRSYVLHRLFGQLESTSLTAASVTTGGATSSSRLFPFPYKANVIDRDEVLIPMGWDSWGKIKILRDGFNPAVVGNGWLLDIEKYRHTLANPDTSVGGNQQNETEDTNWDNEGRKIVSACKLWEDMIGEPDDDMPSFSSHDRVTVTPEQQFLKAKYEQIKKERDLDPRTHFQMSTKGHSAQQSAKFANGTLLSDKNGLAPGSSSLSVMNAEEEMNARLNKLSMRDHSGVRSTASSLSPVELLHLQQQQAQALTQSPRSPRPSLTNHTASKLSSSSLSRSNSTVTGTGAPAEKEVLASFFGRLLVKDSTGSRSSNGNKTTNNNIHSRKSSLSLQEGGGSSSEIGGNDN